MSKCHGARKSELSSRWFTPYSLFHQLDCEFGFTLDAAAEPEHHMCPVYYSTADDGLQQPWTGVVWCNPPYGRELYHWVRKAADSAREGAAVVMLLPSRTGAAWFHELALPLAEIRFIRGRLRFSGSKINAPFDSLIAVFKPPLDDAPGIE
jgi:site-specific DNA-methyltransferase (adenine-specific)